MSSLCVIFSRRSEMRLVLLLLVIEEGWVVVLLHELLGRLVDIHVGHLFSSLCSSCLLSLLGLFFLFLLGLNTLELLEYILIMKQGVGKFILKRLACKESFNSALNDWYLQQLMNCWSLCWIALEHHGYDIGNGWAEMRG